MNSKYYEPYDIYDDKVRRGEIPNTPISQIEKDKAQWTREMDAARDRGDYKEVIRLAMKIADSCHRQGKERDAYLLEHEAFLYTQKQVYREACISIKSFRNTPYVERLKAAMTEAADQAMTYKNIEYAICYKKMIARLCRVQGKENDARNLEYTIRSMSEKVRDIMRNKNLTDSELESQCLKWIAQKYGTSLSDD